MTLFKSNIIYFMYPKYIYIQDFNLKETLNSQNKLISHFTNVGKDHKLLFYEGFRDILSFLTIAYIYIICI